MAELTENAFRLLMRRLDGDETIAGQKYELLRLKLTKLLNWRGATDAVADALAEEAIDRVAAKLEQGIEIGSITAFSCQVARFVWMEFERRNKESAWDDDRPHPPAPPVADNDEDTRLACLRKCLIEVTKNDDRERTLILTYYNADQNQKNKDIRKDLAATLGVTTNTLKVRMCRIRVKLEKCVTKCV